MNKGIMKELAEVQDIYGAHMLNFVMGTGLASEAAERLAEVAIRTNEQVALMQLVQSYNQLAEAHVKVKEWKAQTISECEQAIHLAMSKKIIVAGRSSLVLPN